MEEPWSDPGALARQFAPAVYRLAYARTGSRADAEDVMQETFLRMVKAKPVFESEVHAQAWLLRVAANCANDLFRLPWRKREEPLEEGLSAPEEPEAGGVAAAAILVCAALAITAAAAGPTVWDALQARLGTFAPYAVPAEGTAVDQDIEVALVGSISDNYTARVYFTATDLAGGRFNDHTHVDAMLEGTLSGMSGGFGCQILSYDEAQKQFLLEANVDGLDVNEPVTLEVSSFNPGYHYVHANFQPPRATRS